MPEMSEGGWRLILKPFEIIHERCSNHRFAAVPVANFVDAALQYVCFDYLFPVIEKRQLTFRCIRLQFYCAYTYGTQRLAVPVFP